MPIALILGWQLFGGFFKSTIIPLLKAIPWQVWLALGIVVAFFIYGSVREKRGYARCEVVYETKIQQERLRQAGVVAKVQEEATGREKLRIEELEALRNEHDRLKTDAEALLNKMGKQPEGTKGSQVICLPESITDRFIAAERLRAKRQKGNR